MPVPSPLAGVPVESWLSVSRLSTALVVALLSVTDCAAVKAKSLLVLKLIEPAPTVSGEVGVIPWMVVAFVHCAIWFAVGVPVLDTLPPPLGAALVQLVPSD